MNAVCRRKSRKSFKRVDLNVCALCLGSQKDEEKYGKFFQSEKEQLAAHQFCLFFASGLAQNGEDEEGFDGFLYDDIRVEIARASKLMCTLCKKKGASIGCCVSKCKTAFHFCCGLERLALFQFFGSFRAFCRYHRPSQKKSIQSTSQLCPICLCDIDYKDGINSISSPCCKNSLFHRTCLQKQALASGMHFFRCALCNNLETFQQEMNRMGIYIPERDAAWEQGDAYADLLQSYNKCDTSTCVCPNGREFTGESEGKKWEICLCHTCGQSGTHLQCKGWARPLPRWLCNDCEVILLNNSLQSIKSLESSPKPLVVNEPLDTGRNNEQEFMFTTDGSSVENSSEALNIVDCFDSSTVQSHNLVDLVANLSEDSCLMALTVASSGSNLDKISEASSGALPIASSNCDLVENPDVLCSSLTSESTITLEDPMNAMVYSSDDDPLEDKESAGDVMSTSKKRRFLPSYKEQYMQQIIRKKKQKKGKRERSKLSPKTKQNGLVSSEKEKKNSLSRKEGLESLDINLLQALAKDGESMTNALMSCSGQGMIGNHYRTDSAEREEPKKATKKTATKSARVKGKTDIESSMNCGIKEVCSEESKVEKAKNEMPNACSDKAATNRHKYKRKCRKQSVQSTAVQDTISINSEELIKRNTSILTKDRLNIDSEAQFTTGVKKHEEEDTLRLGKAVLTNDSEATSSNRTTSIQNQLVKSIGKLDALSKKQADIGMDTSEQETVHHGLDGSFSLSLDVSADSETLGSHVKPGTASSACYVNINSNDKDAACDVSIISDSKDKSILCLTPTKSPRIATNSRSPYISHFIPDCNTSSSKNVSSCRTPSSSPKKSPSSRSPCIKSRKSLSGQLDLFGMLTSQRRKKRKLSPEFKKFSTEDKSPYKSTKRLKRRRVLDNSCHRSIMSYMNASPRKPSAKKSKTSVGKAEKSPLQSCFEAASQFFSSTVSKLSGLYQKNHGEDVFIGESSSKPLNTSVTSIVSDSDTDSTSSVKVVKVVKKKDSSDADTRKKEHAPYSSDEVSLTIVLDDDSDGQDSGRGGSRDNSDGAISCTSFSDGKGSNEDLNESFRVEADGIDEGIFLGADDSKVDKSDLFAKHDDLRANNQSSQLLEEGRHKEMTAKLSRRRLKVEQLTSTSSPIKRRRKIQKKPLSKSPSRSSISESTSTETHILSTQTAVSSSQTSISLKRKLHSVKTYPSSSVVEENSSDESVVPLRKRHRTISLSKTAKANLSQYNECSDEDFQSKKKRSSFKLIICQNKQKGAKKKLDDSFLTIDLSSQEL